GRKRIIAASIAVWSVTTALCGLAKGFASLFLARVGVGVGEAGGSPAAQALVAECFPKHLRGRALGLLFLHIPIGYVVSFKLGGWAADAFGWRNTFFLFGAPGVLIALLVAMTVREPALAAQKASSARGWAESLSLLRTPSLLHIFAGGTIFAIG